MSENYKTKVALSRTKEMSKPVVSSMQPRPREGSAAPISHEFNLGPFVVRVSNKQHYRLYTIYTPQMDVLGKQASYPSIADCLDKLDVVAAKGEVSRAVQGVLRNNRETQAYLKLQQQLAAEQRRLYAARA